MKNSAADFLLTVHKELPTDLVNKLYSSKILEVAQNLPIVSVVSYECRLAQDLPQVDIALCAYGSDDAQTLTKMVSPDYADNRDHKHASKAWQKVSEFSKMWVSEKGFLRQFVSALWMNIDVDLNDPSIRAPWIYVVFAKSNILIDLKIAMLTKSLYLFEPNFSRIIVDQMTTQIIQLPKKAHLLGLGIQSARQVGTLRLVIYDLDLTGIAYFLKRSNWLGDHKDFYNQMVDFEPLAESLGFVFDVDEYSIRTLVAVEFYISRKSHLLNLEKLLQPLVKRNLCSEKKSTQITEWVKKSNKTKKDNMKRWVSHVKISYETGNSLEAKIYLFHRCLSPTRTLNK